MSIKKLDWDSDFFGISIGETTDEGSYDNAADYQLLILKQTDNKTILFDGFENSFQEIKIVYSKKLVPKHFDFSLNIIDADFESIKSDQLYSLAYESGKYSRFKRDPNFKEDQFKELYKKWIDNSLNKQFADKIFYIKNKNETLGFVTVKCHAKHASIGLIAVSEDYQGKGVGMQLLQSAEQYCLENEILELQIPTQKENEVACNFYEKLGYSILEEKYIKHYWKV